MRPRVLAMAGAALTISLAVTGCARLEHPTAVPEPSISIPPGQGEFQTAPSPSPVPTPAQAAGGTCKLIDYASVEQATGTTFEVAAASNADRMVLAFMDFLFCDCGGAACGRPGNHPHAVLNSSVADVGQTRRVRSAPW